MSFSVALHTAALLLKNANKFSVPLVALVNEGRRDARRELIARLTKAILADQEANHDLISVVSNLLDREITSFEPMEILAELKEAWRVNNMQDWIRLGRTLGVFSQKDLVGWAWIVSNWEASQDDGRSD